MFSLTPRKLRGDIIEAFKLIHGIDKVKLGKIFCIDEDGRGKHSLYLKIRWHKNLSIGLNFYIWRDINYWNTSQMNS